MIASSRGCEAASSAQAGSPAMPWIAIELRPPGPGLRHPPGSSPGPAALQATDTGGCAPPPSPHPPDLGWSSFKRRNDTGSLRIPSRLAHRSGPSGSPEPARLCRGCFHPPRHPQVRLPPASNPRLPWQGDKVSHVHPKHQRLVAQHKDLTGSSVGYTTADSAHSQPYITPATPCRATSHPGPSSIPPGQSLFPDAALDAAESVDRSRGADCSAPVTPTKRVGCSNKRVAAVDSASACFPWIVARGEALR